MSKSKASKTGMDQTYAPNQQPEHEVWEWIKQECPEKVQVDIMAKDRKQEGGYWILRGS